jgi:hypothetical protein
VEVTSVFDVMGVPLKLPLKSPSYAPTFPGADPVLVPRPPKVMTALAEGDNTPTPALAASERTHFLVLKRLLPVRAENITGEPRP